ncbi:MAG: class I SAM-dependent methyltransferase [Planctomycetota bacterium]|nr:class I SAM-dependent methyltransferase [Planctomycetota bacterium]
MTVEHLKNSILDRVTAVEQTRFSRDAWSIVRCRETGFVFLANPPDYSQLETEYAWEKTTDVERRRRKLDEPAVARLSLFAKKAKKVIFPNRNKIASLAFAELQAKDQSEPLRILDIGCGCGNLMVEIYNRCVEVGRSVKPIGIEVSRELAPVSQENVAPLGGKVVCSNALDAANDLEPDTIHLAVMSSFLEHECQPLRLLARLHSILTQDGSIVLKVPNYACWNRYLRGSKWCGFRYPDHVNYFTPTTLRRLAAEAGFTVSRQNLFDKFPLSDNMYAVLTKSAERSHLPKPSAGPVSDGKSSAQAR